MSIITKPKIICGRATRLPIQTRRLSGFNTVFSVCEKAAIREATLTITHPTSTNATCIASPTIATGTGLLQRSGVPLTRKW